MVDSMNSIDARLQADQNMAAMADQFRSMSPQTIDAIGQRINEGAHHGDPVNRVIYMLAQLSFGQVLGSLGDKGLDFT